MLKDAVGTVIQENDMVVHAGVASHGKSASLTIATVIGFTAKKVRLSRGKLDYRGNLITYLRDPRSVAVVAITDEVQL